MELGTHGLGLTFLSLSSAISSGRMGLNSEEWSLWRARELDVTWRCTHPELSSQELRIGIQRPISALVWQRAMTLRFPTFPDINNVRPGDRRGIYPIPRQVLNLQSTVRRGLQKLRTVSRLRRFHEYLILAEMRTHETRRTKVKNPPS